MHFLLSSDEEIILKSNTAIIELNKSFKAFQFDLNAQTIFSCHLKKPTLYYSVSFPLCLDFLENPTRGINVIKFRNGYSIHFSSNFLMPVVMEQIVLKTELDFENLPTFVTVTRGLEYKIYISNARGTNFFLFPLDLKNLSVEKCKINNTNFVLLKADYQGIFISIIEPKSLKLVFQNSVYSYEILSDLTTMLKFANIRKHSAKTVWKYNNNFDILTYDLTAKPYSASSYNQKLLPYLFLEELLIYGNELNLFATEEIVQNQNNLREYLGQFIAVEPPPFFEKQDCVCLYYYKKDNLFETKMFSFEISEGKISNIYET